jgi:N-dimethylarginine dimethylaminohydrolase
VDEKSKTGIVTIMKSTYHSESGKIKSVFIKNVRHAFVNEEAVSNQWKALNYLGKPDLSEAEEEYRKFETLLKSEGAELHYFPQDSSVSMDSIYCRDAAIATDGGVIICNMGKPARANEPEAERKAFEKKGIKILGNIKAPGTVEGGDVAWLDEKTLAVGHTYRTNPEGIEQLRALLKPIGVNVISVPLPHYRGPSDVFHLMSILSPVDKNLAVVYSPLMPIVFRQELLARGYELVEVPDNEFDSMGCNVLAIAPRKCLMVAGNPKTKAGLEKAGCKVLEYEGQEISVKGGGGPTCLTRPMEREW